MACRRYLRAESLKVAQTTVIDKGGDARAGSCQLMVVDDMVRCYTLPDPPMDLRQDASILEPEMHLRTGGV